MIFSVFALRQNANMQTNANTQKNNYKYIINYLYFVYTKMLYTNNIIINISE